MMAGERLLLISANLKSFARKEFKPSRLFPRNFLAESRTRVYRKVRIKKCFLFIQFPILVLFACTSAPQQGNDGESPFYPLHIVKVESQLVDIKYRVIGATRSIPPHYIKREDGYVYAIYFTLVFRNGNRSWQQPFYVQIEYPDGKTEEVEFNSERMSFLKNILYDFNLEVEVKQRDEVWVTVGHQIANGEIIFETDNPFKSKVVSLR